MGKAKMFGGAALGVGAVFGLLAWAIVPGSFLSWLIYTYVPILLVTIGLIAAVIGILLLVYG